MKRYSFCGYQFVYDTGEITRDGHTQVLRPKTTRLLAYIIDHRDRILSRDELLEQVWEDASVTPNVLYQSIKEIRNIFGSREAAEPFLSNIRHRGYQWVCNDTILLETVENTDNQENTLEPEPIEEIQDIDLRPQPILTPQVINTHQAPAPAFYQRWLFPIVSCVALLLTYALGFHLGKKQATTHPMSHYLDHGKLKIAVINDNNKDIPIDCKLKKLIGDRFQVKCITRNQVRQFLDPNDPQGLTFTANLSEFLHTDIALIPAWDKEKSQLSYVLETKQSKTRLDHIPFESLEEALHFVTHRLEDHSDLLMSVATVTP